MAKSGSTSVTVTNYDTLTFYWEVLNQSPENGYTTVRWRMDLKAGSAGKIISSVAKKWSVTVNGTTYSGTNYVNIGNNETKTLASGTTTIYHIAAKTFSYSFSQQFGINFADEDIGTKTGSGSGVLDAIAITSSISGVGGYLSTKQTINVKQSSTSYTHSIKAICGTSTLYISGNGTTSTSEVIHNRTSIQWTPPADWARQNTTGEYVDVKFVTTTYNGSTVIGTENKAAQYLFPDTAEFYPSVTVTIKDPWGIGKTLGGWVQGQSVLDIYADCEGAYGSTIPRDGVFIEFDGKTYYQKDLIETVNSAGTLPIKISVTDTRGRTTIINREIFVQEYKRPAIYMLTGTRCDEDGELNPLGDHILVTFDARVYGLNNNNTATYYVGWKKITETNHQYKKLDYPSDQYTIHDTYIVPADADSSYVIIFSVLDEIFYEDDTLTRKTIEVSSAKMPWSMMLDGNEIVGMAFNKVAEHEGYIDFGLPVKFDGGGDFVEEQGQKDNWYYRKWHSGLMECQKVLTHSTAVDKAWGSMYVGSTAMARQSYPVAFVSRPVEVASVASGANAVWLFAESGGNGVNGAYASAIYNVCRPSAVSAAGTYYIAIKATGRWK